MQCTADWVELDHAPIYRHHGEVRRARLAGDAKEQEGEDCLAARRGAPARHEHKPANQNTEEGAVVA